MGNFKPYGLVGILFIFIAIALAIVSFYLGKKTRNKDNTYNLVLLVSAITLLIMEILHEFGRYKALGGYDWTSFPFQFCTVPMYLSFIIPCLKKGKIRDNFVMFMCLFTFLSGILPIVFAQGNLFRWDKFYQILFSFAWHLILFFLGGFSIGYLNIAKNFKLDSKKIIGACIIFVSLTVIAQLLNVMIHTFANPLPFDGIKEVGYIKDYWRDPDSASLFYISPYFKSNIAIIFGTVWVKLGWVVNWILYDVIFIFGAYVVYYITFLIRKVIDKIRQKRQNLII